MAFTLGLSGQVLAQAKLSEKDIAPFRNAFNKIAAFDPIATNRTDDQIDNFRSKLCNDLKNSNAFETHANKTASPNPIEAKRVKNMQKQR